MPKPSNKNRTFPRKTAPISTPIPATSPNNLEAMEKAGMTPGFEIADLSKLQEYEQKPISLDEDSSEEQLP